MSSEKTKLTFDCIGENKSLLPIWSACRAWIIVFLAFISITESVNAIHYRVYLIGGQSNGNGRGDASELVAPLNVAQSDVLFYWHKTQVTPNGNLIQDTWVDLQPDSGHGINDPSSFAVEFGSELTFGRTLADADPSVNIAIIKYTHGGTNLRANWAEGGFQYNTFITTVEEGLTALTDAGHTYEVGGMTWLQGEADTGAGSAEYEDNLNDLIVRIRRDVFGGPALNGFTLPFVITGLSNSQYSDITTIGSGPNTVRQAQEAVASSARQAAFVNTDGFSTYTSSVHFDATGQIDIGVACANAILSLEAQDADRDGLLISEEEILGTDPDKADTDLDGQQDGLESGSGTDPTNASSVLRIENITIEDNLVNLEWPSRPGNTYMVEHSSDLITWSQIASDYPASDTGTSTTWIGTTTGEVTIGSQNIAFYDGGEGVEGDFNNESFDSVDNESLTTASRINHGGGLNGGGAGIFILDSPLFNTSSSGPAGFNLGGATAASQNAAETNGDFISFESQSNGNLVTYENLSFYANQFGTSAQIDVSYKAGSNPEVFVLQNFSPIGSNANVALQNIDFADFTTDENVVWTFYLYGSALSIHGIRLDDIALTGDVPNVNIPNLPASAFFRVGLTGVSP